MAMTLTQIEKYMIAEIENLHLKFDSAFEMLIQKIEDLTHEVRGILKDHEARITIIEMQNNQ